jgi:HK97 family phage prohead protease
MAKILNSKAAAKDIRTADFSGWATVYNVPCTDGRTIKHGAFDAADMTILPLVWRHLHDSPSNTIGHVLVHAKPEGAFVYGWFNGTSSGRDSKEQVKHGDLDSLSIYANELVESKKLVHSGKLREVSLVYSGANPEAKITNVALQHDDGTDDTILDNEAVIESGRLIELPSDNVMHEDSEDESLAVVFKAALAKLSEKEQEVIYAVIGLAGGESSVAQSDENFDDEGAPSNMKKNIFYAETKSQDNGAELTHEHFVSILASAQEMGSLKKAVIAHAGEDYGITNASVLFPDARSMTREPELVRRDMGWVSEFLPVADHQPFSRIKSMTADLTEDTARARGYITASEKSDMFFAVAKRDTGPQTVYIKSKMDRDDIIDVTDFSVVAWLKSKMRLLLDEEIARAGLLSDGRLVANPLKIKEDKIRPIWKDDALFNHRVEIASNATILNTIDAITRARKNYKGTGAPKLFTTADWATEMLLVRDSTGRRVYPTMAELESALRVSKVVEVEPMEGLSRVDGERTLNLVGILVNPTDYTYGADKGGEVNFFDDFDINFNQELYLIEARCSGALTKPKSAVTIEQVAAAG